MNDQERNARKRKVIRLTVAARNVPGPLGPITADVLARLDDDGWAALAGLAHVNPPSPVTRAAVVAEVRKEEAR